MLTETLGRLAALVAEQINAGQYNVVDDLDTAALADWLGESEANRTAFCGAVTRLLNPLPDGTTMEFGFTTNLAVMRVLGFDPSTLLLMYAPAYAFSSLPLGSSGLAMWERTHFWYVTRAGVLTKSGSLTLGGLRYGGQVTYEQVAGVTNS